MKSIEEIILENSNRGMNVIREHMEDGFCRKAAEEILKWQRGTVLLTTGFYVAGHGESDGPSGTLCVALALKKLGFRCVIVTDETCMGYFELKGFEVVYLQPGDDDAVCRGLIDRYWPVGMISIERCGRNIEGYYANMRNCSITSHVAPADRLFELAYGKIPTIGIGDGGNEIGMGNVADTISAELDIVPCRVRTDFLIIATVSNWGAFGLVAYLQQLTGMDLMPDAEDLEHYYRMGCVLRHVDGVTRECDADTVDGIDRETELELVEEMMEVITEDK